VSKKKARKTALRRRNRAERPTPVVSEYAREILDALNRAGAPLAAADLKALGQLVRGERRPRTVQRFEDLAAVFRIGNAGPLGVRNAGPFYAVSAPKRCFSGLLL
jgi:hypothetical protein